jgi:hypothetical protein
MKIARAVSPVKPSTRVRGGAMDGRHAPLYNRRSVSSGSAI